MIRASARAQLSSGDISPICQFSVDQPGRGRGNQTGPGASRDNNNWRHEDTQARPDRGDWRKHATHHPPTPTPGTHQLGLTLTWTFKLTLISPESATSEADFECGRQGVSFISSFLPDIELSTAETAGLETGDALPACPALAPGRSQT